MTESISQNIYSGAKTLTRYKYDHDGNRVVKSSNYGEVVTPSAEISYKNDSIVTKHIFVSGVRVASKVCDEKSSNTYYQSVDHLGSTNLLTDAEGNFYEHIETFPDGNIWVKEYVDQSGVNATYTNYEMDVETKLFYDWARYYDAQLGRFISVDPIIGSYLDGKSAGGVFVPGNLNMYSYTYNNPLKYIDPDGKTVKQHTKRVSGTNNHHAWLVATPDNQKAFQKYFNKANIDSGKVKRVGGTDKKPIYAIIFRAGPKKDNPFNHGKLDNTVRLEEDWVAGKTSDVEIKAPLGKNNKPISDTKFINLLLKADSNFTKNLNDKKVDTPNYPHLGGIGWPEPSERNSNSYVSGILHAVGAKPSKPSIPDVIIGMENLEQSAPLYDKPVPTMYFQ